jgi:hypothetical protein
MQRLSSETLAGIRKIATNSRNPHEFYLRLHDAYAEASPGIIARRNAEADKKAMLIRAYGGASTVRIPEHLKGHPLNNVPKAPQCPGASTERCVTPAERVQLAKTALLAAEAQAAALAAKQAADARIAFDLDLARATTTLLTDIKDGYREHREAFARHRTALQPLAKSYGFKIVLVEDKSVATLVVA